MLERGTLVRPGFGRSSALVAALAPGLGRKLLQVAAEAPESNLRLAGAAAVAVGVLVIWLVHG